MAAILSCYRQGPLDHRAWQSLARGSSQRAERSFRRSTASATGQERLSAASSIAPVQTLAEKPPSTERQLVAGADRFRGIARHNKLRNLREAPSPGSL
jgi:hypothetical protein